MKVTAKSYLSTSIIFIITLLPERIASADDDSDIINPNWVKPGWRSNRHRYAEVPASGDECQCPAVPECAVVGYSTKQTPAEEENDRLGLTFYRKFLNRLFDEKKLVMEEQNSYFKLRNVQFKITDQQLRKLKEAQTARDIDAVVTSIVEQSETSVYQAMAENVCWNIVEWYGKAMQSSIFLYVIVPAIVILSVLSIGKLLGIRLWVLIPVLGILITYVLTYRDCNNKLELESLTKLMKTDGSNPCGKHHRSGWYHWLLQKDNEAECIEHLREQYGLKRNFCDPSEVFVEMVAKLHLQYFETFVLKMISIFKVSTASSGVVETLLISGFILFLIYLLMTVGIKYGLYAGGRLLSDLITRSRTPEQAPVQGDARQAPAQLPPAPPFNIHININRPRRANSRVDEPITNRIEEITDRSSEPTVVGAIAPVPAEETSRRQKEDGSGDGPAAVTNETTTDEGESTDEETVMIQCDLAEDVRKNGAEHSTDNQSKTSVDQ